MYTILVLCLVVESLAWQYVHYPDPVFSSGWLGRQDEHYPGPLLSYGDFGVAICTLAMSCVQ